MPSAVVVGGSVAGLATALALHGNRWDVLVLERSAPPPRETASDSGRTWRRPTVPQAQQSHTLTSLGVRVLRQRAPGVLDALLASGAVLFDLTTAMPPGAVDRTRRADDDDLVALGCRRTTLELTLHRLVTALPRVNIRYLTQVDGVMPAPGRPAVHGVVTRTGERIPADVVVDATGRRAAARAWLAEAGHPVGDDLTSPSGLAGFARFYRLRGTDLPGPLNRGHAAGDVWDHYAGVLHPGDAGTFAVAIGTLPGDRGLASLNTPAAFTTAARATPWLGPWLADDASGPISAVHVMTSPPNALRVAAVSPSLAGLYPVGDAVCVTNPLFGRGMSLALAHAFDLADLLSAHPATDRAQADAAARLAETTFRPWYELAASADRSRIAHWRAAAHGTPPPPPADTAARRPSPRAMAAAAASDAVVWRGLTRMAMSLNTPEEVLGDEAFISRVARAPAAAPAHPCPPTRAALVSAIATTEGP